MKSSISKLGHRLSFNRGPNKPTFKSYLQNEINENSIVNNSCIDNSHNNTIITSNETDKQDCQEAKQSKSFQNDYDDSSDGEQHLNDTSSMDTSFIAAVPLRKFINNPIRGYRDSYELNTVTTPQSSTTVFAANTLNDDCFYSSACLSMKETDLINDSFNTSIMPVNDMQTQTPTKQSTFNFDYRLKETLLVKPLDGVIRFNLHTGRSKGTIGQLFLTNFRIKFATYHQTNTDQSINDNDDNFHSAIPLNSSPSSSSFISNEQQQQHQSFSLNLNHRSSRLLNNSSFSSVTNSQIPSSFSSLSSLNLPPFNLIKINSTEIYNEDIDILNIHNIRSKPIQASGFTKYVLLTIYLNDFRCIEYQLRNDDLVKIFIDTFQKLIAENSITHSTSPVSTFNSNVSSSCTSLATTTSVASNFTSNQNNNSNNTSSSLNRFIETPCLWRLIKSEYSYLYPNDWLINESHWYENTNEQYLRITHCNESLHMCNTLPPSFISLKAYLNDVTLTSLISKHTRGQRVPLVCYAKKFHAHSTINTISNKHKTLPAFMHQMNLGHTEQRHRYSPQFSRHRRSPSTTSQSDHLQYIYNQNFHIQQQQQQRQQQQPTQIHDYRILMRSVILNDDIMNLLCQAITPLRVIDVNAILPNLLILGNAYGKLQRACLVTLTDTSQFLSSTGKWLKVLSKVLSIIKDLTKIISNEASLILIEDTDTHWNPLLTSLLQIIIDEKRRTIVGFESLLAKEWLYLSGMNISKSNQILFLLFLDCVAQLINQNPRSFQFTTLYLINLFDLMYLPISNCENIEKFRSNDVLCDDNSSSGSSNITRSSGDENICEKANQFGVTVRNNSLDTLLFLHNPLYKIKDNDDLKLNDTDDEDNKSDDMVDIDDKIKRKFSIKINENENDNLKIDSNILNLQLWKPLYLRWHQLTNDLDYYNQFDLIEFIYFQSLLKPLCNLHVNSEELIE